MHGNALCAHDHYARGLGSQDSEVRTALQLKLAGHHVADQVGQAISIYVLLFESRGRAKSARVLIDEGKDGIGACSEKKKIARSAPMASVD